MTLDEKTEQEMKAEEARRKLQEEEEAERAAQKEA